MLSAATLCLWLYLPEMGVKGPAFVRSVEACPAVAEGDDADSRVVTATFRAKLGVPWTLRVDGVDEPIRVTGDHHVWSEDRLAWVRVDELEPGERVQLEDEPRRIVLIESGTDSEEVFDLEVDGDHCYRVSSGGVLVHNKQPRLLCSVIADSNVFLDRPGAPGGIEARPIFDNLIDEGKIRFIVPRAVMNEVGDTASQVDRVARAWIRAIRNSPIARRIANDHPEIVSSKFGDADLVLVETARRLDLPIVTANHKMINQIQNGPDIRRKLYGNVAASILVPGKHFSDSETLFDILSR